MIVNHFDKTKNHSIVVGELWGFTFTKEVKKKHFCWKYAGYGIQKDIIDKLKERCCRMVIIKELYDKKRIWKSNFNDWLDWGARDNLGHGEQIFLPISKMVNLHEVKNEKH